MFPGSFKDEIMALVKIKFAPSAIMALFYTEAASAFDVVRSKQELYQKESVLFQVDGDSQEAAEDAFDLTNNPSREDERQ